jgi:phosphoglycerate dehydrogenase-like enzyme
MPELNVVLAGASFPAIRQYLTAALPGVRLKNVDSGVIRERGCTAEILIPAMTAIDGDMMDRVRDLRLIQQWGTGLDRVDVEAASQRGIAVANVPSAGSGNAESVAEWCVMAAIAISRRLPILQYNILTGASWGGPRGNSLLGRTAGIVGLGGIGQALAIRLQPFGMRLLGLQRNPDRSLAERLGMLWVGGPDQLPELLRESDYVFLCLPLNPQTRELIDRKALDLLPDQACIINAGRGGLLNEKALLRALDAGRLLGIALDVFDQEPLDVSSPLLSRPDVLATPHIAGITDLAYQGIARCVADNILRVAEGMQPLNCVNWPALMHARPPQGRFGAAEGS